MIFKKLIFSLLIIASASGAFAQLSIGSIEITGNKKTKDFVIKREMLLQAGDKVSEDSITQLIDRSAERITNLNLFNLVTIQSNRQGDSLDLEVHVVEKWYLWPIPTVEFADRNFNIWADSSFDPARANYGLYLFKYNLFGRNHTLKASIIGGYNTKLALEYRLPFFSREHQSGIQARIAYVTQDELWASTVDNRLQFYASDRADFIRTFDADLIFTRRLKPMLMWRAGAAYTQMEMDGEGLEHTDNYFVNNDSFQQLYTVYSGITNDSRDNIYLPKRGHLLYFGLGLEHYRNSGQLNNIVSVAKAQQFNRIGQRLYSAFSMLAIYNSNNDLPYRFKRMLGYEYHLRGFEPYVIDGTRGFLANAAIRFSLFDKIIPLEFIPIENYSFLPVSSFLEYFIDAGAAFDDQVIPGNDFGNSLLFSTGLSLQTLFYNDRVLRFEYSLNSIGQSGIFIHFNKAI